MVARRNTRGCTENSNYKSLLYVSTSCTYIVYIRIDIYKIIHVYRKTYTFMYLHIHIYENDEKLKSLVDRPYLGWWIFFSNKTSKKGHFFSCRAAGAETRGRSWKQATSGARRITISAARCKPWVTVSHRHRAWHGWETSGSHSP